MTAHEQINAIHSALYIIRTVAKESVHGSTNAETVLVAAMYNNAVEMTAKLERHYDADNFGLTEEQWDQIPIDSMADYTEEEVST